MLWNRRSSTRIIVTAAVVVGTMWYGLNQTYGADGNQETGTSVKFYEEIVPILKAKCQACHGGSVHEGDLSLDQYEKVMAGGSGGVVIVPGNAEKSLLYLVAARREEPHMPPLPNDLKITALTEPELTLLKNWINQGAVEGKKNAPQATRFRSLRQNRRQIYSLSLSPDQRWLVASHANHVSLYDLLTGKGAGHLEAPGLQGAVDHDYVQAVSFSPQGDRIATGGYRNVKIWKREPPRSLASCKLDQSVTLSRVNPERTHVAFLLADSSVSIRDLETLQERGAIPAGESPLVDIAYSSTGSGLILARSNGQLEWRDPMNGSMQRVMQMPSPVRALQPQSAEVALITSHEDNAIRLWSEESLDQTDDSSSPTPVQVLGGLMAPATRMAAVPVQFRLYTAGEDGKLRGWDLKTGTVLWEKTSAAPITFLAVSEDGSRVAFGADDGSVTVHVADGSLVADVRASAGLVRSEQHHATSVEVAQRRMNRAAEKLQQSERDLNERKSQHESAQQQIRNSEQALVQAESKLLTVSNEVAQAEKQLQADPEQAALKLAVSEAESRRKKESDGLEAARSSLQSAKRTASQAEQSLQFGTDQVRRRQAALEQTQVDLEDAKRLALVATQQRELSGRSLTGLCVQNAHGVLYATASGETVRAWNLKTGAPLDAPDFSGGSPDQLVATKGDQFLTVDTHGNALLCDTAPVWSYERTLGPADSTPQGLENSSIVHRVNALAFSPDGEWLASAGGDPSREGEVLLWSLSEPADPIEFKDAHSDTVLDIRFSRDGQELVTGGADKFSKLFDIQNRSLLKSFEGHTEHVQGVAMSADELLLATAGGDRLLKIWDVETGELIRTIDNSSRPLTSAAFIGASDRVLSASGDGHVKIHGAQSGKNERSFVGAQDYVYAAIASPDGTLVIAGGEDGVIHVWNGMTGDQIYAITESPSDSDHSAK